jgi:hypothetical protein
MKPYAARLARIVGLLALLIGCLTCFNPYPLSTLASADIDRQIKAKVPALSAPLDEDSKSAAEPATKTDAITPRIQTNKERLVPPKDTSCSTIWASYPQGGYAIPDWLYTPSQPSDLATDEPYLYLAGRLLQEGLTSAPDCPYNGLMPSGFASPCGLEAARLQVTAWQNRFDALIYKSSVENAVPASLLKRIFAQESQFWLGQSTDNQHFGIGQITEGGIDPLFLSYPDYYKLVCTDVLSAETCKNSYIELSSQNKALIRGYFVRTVIDASCPDCAEKYDPKKAKETIDIFARLVVANCEQVGRVIGDITEQKPGTVSTYDDLWRYTLLNYNGGSGCVSGAIEATVKANEPVDWMHVSARLQNHCKGSQAYVEKVSR